MVEGVGDLLPSERGRSGGCPGWVYPQKLSKEPGVQLRVPRVRHGPRVGEAFLPQVGAVLCALQTVTAAMYQVSAVTQASGAAASDAYSSLQQQEVDTLVTPILRMRKQPY